MTAHPVRDRVAPVIHRDDVPAIELTTEPLPDRQPRWLLPAVSILVGALAAVITTTLYRPAVATPTPAPTPTPTLAHVLHTFHAIGTGPFTIQSSGETKTTVLRNGEEITDATLVVITITDTGTRQWCYLDVDDTYAVQERTTYDGQTLACIWRAPS